jgi:FkbM family methyltransferase
VKAKEFFYLLGLRPQPKEYGFTVAAYDLPMEGRVEVAEWLHPQASHGAPSQVAVTHLRRFLSPGDVAIDIGAHTGDTTLPIALAVGPSGLVLALEPNPYVFPILERNSSLNPDKTRIVPLKAAAMRAPGRYEFQYGEAGFCNGGYHEGMSRWLHGSAFKVQVEGLNVQEYLAREHPELIPRLRFIKVDAEGFDLAILETLEELIRRQRPFLQVEVFTLRKSLPGYRRKLFDFLVGHGYQLFRVEGGERFLGEEVTEANLLQWKHYDLFCVPAGQTLKPGP